MLEIEPENSSDLDIEKKVKQKKEGNNFLFDFKQEDIWGPSSRMKDILWEKIEKNKILLGAFWGFGCLMGWLYVSNKKYINMSCLPDIFQASKSQNLPPCKQAAPFSIHLRSSYFQIKPSPPPST